MQRRLRCVLKLVIIANVRKKRVKSVVVDCFVRCNMFREPHSVSRSAKICQICGVALIDRATRQKDNIKLMPAQLSKSKNQCPPWNRDRTQEKTGGHPAMVIDDDIIDISAKFGNCNDFRLHNHSNFGAWG